MKLGIMQPYFFPHLGYFDLINLTDHWVVFDTAQFVRHGWMNRNRILHPKEGWQYITMPVNKHSRDTAVKDIKVSKDPKCRSRILGQIQHYQKKAPYFRQTHQLVEEVLAVDESSLSRLNATILGRICSYLEISFEYEFFSEMSMSLGPVEGPGDWALRIAEALGVTEYVNPPGGARLFDPSKFESLGIKLTIRNLPFMEYTCGNQEFIPGLSIIDVLMWNPPDKVHDYLQKHKPWSGDSPQVLCANKLGIYSLV